MKPWNRIEQWFKLNYMRLLESTMARPRLTPADIDISSIHRILVIRPHDQLGDYLLSSPVLSALRGRFPNAHISLLTRSYVAPVAAHHRDVDDLIVFQDNGRDWTLPELRKSWRQLRRGFDLAVVLNTVSHSLTSDLIAGLSRSRYILGPDHLRFPGTRCNFFYDLEAPVRDGARHQTERNLDVLGHIGIPPQTLGETMTLLPEEERAARAYLLDRGVSGEDFVVGVHPGAGKLGNRWPAARFADVCNWLADSRGARIVATWGPNEEELGDEVLANLDAPPVVASGLSLRELAGVLSQFNLFLCNDTGVMHVAASVGTPLVAVFGPTDPAQWKPLGDQFVAVRGKDNLCGSVEVGEMREAVERLLSILEA